MVVWDREASKAPIEARQIEMRLLAMAVPKFVKEFSFPTFQALTSSRENVKPLFAGSSVIHKGPRM